MSILQSLHRRLNRNRGEQFQAKATTGQPSAHKRKLTQFIAGRSKARGYRFPLSQGSCLGFPKTALRVTELPSSLRAVLKTDNPIMRP